MEELLAKYGYLAVFLGTLVEGGTLLSMAGFLAHQGYMQFIPWVVLAGFGGNFLDSLICYGIGRHGGQSVAKKKPKWKPRLEELQRWLARYERLTILGVRFVPGFRTVGSVAIGIAEIPWLRFLLLNALGALLWAFTVSLCGYLFGNLLQLFLGKIKQYEIPILLGIGAAGLLTWIGFRLAARRYRARRRERDA